MGHLVAFTAIVFAAIAFAEQKGSKGWSNDISRARRHDDKSGTKQHHITIEENGSTKYDILAITDMDVAARAPDWQFRAITRKGTLNLSNDKKTAQMDWDLSSDRDIMSGFSYKGRGMELSDITEYNGHILSPDDKTGILFEIKNDKALPWVILNAGPGNTTKGMKTEWLTIKRSFLYAGGHGVEYRDDKGVVFSEDQMWIKVISRRGEVRSVNWKDAYVKVREYAGIKAPGYMTHEAVQWSDIHNRWFFLPRKASTTMYDEKADERKGTNLLITADERFNTFDIVRVGPLDHPERGFSAFAFVPGTNDEIIVALKSEEIDGRAPESYVTVFDIHGQILMEDQKLGNHYKFEGIFFL
ncbi:hypothetical protein Y032_0005g2351 [Ancylostoma ceylanicum]|uniref:Apyrase n=1 Tax=Ancylostoma ceylanicum TaxID=53326 RepID=A0A016VT56_9BILA|nr:hypothetical protein Y032_0005g2351 [Ancylostoma ceylanicum]